MKVAWPALIVVSLFMSEFSLRGLTVVRRLPVRAQVGNPHVVEIEVFNHKMNVPSYAIEVEDLRENLPADKRCFFLKISPSSAQIAAYRRTPAKRGRDLHTGFRLATRFPFGLFEKSRELPASGELIIYPAVDPVTLAAPVAGRTLGYEPVMGRGQGEDYVGLKPFRDGEDPRNIHWRKSAAIGSMVLRERGKVLPKFLSNRNFESHYNVGAVLSAFAHVQQQHPAAELVVAGNGSLRASLEAQSESLGLANVTFTGPVAPAAMPALYAAADVYVNASLIDNMPLSLLEAYGSGLPVVTSDAGGIPWIAEHGRTALVVPAGDVDALANAMLDCVRHSDAAQVRARCALDFVAQRFIWSAVRDKWLRAYGVEPGATSTAT